MSELLNYLWVGQHAMDGRLYWAFIALLLSICLSALPVLMGRVGMRTLFEVLVTALMQPIIQRLNKGERGQGALALRGVILAVIWAVLLALFYIPLQFLFLNLNLIKYAHLIVLICLLSTSMPLLYVLQLRRAMADHGGQAKGVFRPLALAVQGDLNALDGGGLARIAIGELLHGLSLRILLPLLAYIALGLYPALVITGLALMVRCARGGQQSVYFHAVFRLMAAPFYVLANAVMVPVAMISALLTPQSGWGSAAGGFSKINTVTNDHFAAVLGAYFMGLALGGPIQNRMGKKVDLPWVGPEGATARIGVHELTRAAYFYGLCLVILLGGLFLALSWSPDVLKSALPELPALPSPALVPPAEIQPIEAGSN